MSSSYTRGQIINFLTANAPTETQVDLTAHYEDLEDILADFSLTDESSWLGIQFIGSDEIPVSVVANNSKGYYRETGAIFLHVVAPAKAGVAADILTRGEALQALFRGRRIGEVVVEGVTPPNFEASSTLQFEGGFTSASVIVNYHRDLSLN